MNDRIPTGEGNLKGVGGGVGVRFLYLVLLVPASSFKLYIAKYYLNVKKLLLFLLVSATVVILLPSPCFSSPEFTPPVLPSSCPHPSTPQKREINLPFPPNSK